MTEQERTARALIGFMDDQEALNFLKGMGIPEGKSDEELLKIWKESKSAADELTARDLAAEVLAIDSQFSSQLDAISKDPLFPEATQKKNWSFMLVEIDKLVCFQKFIYVDHGDNMAKERYFFDTSNLIDFCLSEKASKRPIALVTSPHEFTVLSPSQDLRILGPAQMQDPGTKRSAYGFGVGWGTPFIQVAKFKDRYFLKNGYHRVYAVRKKGVRHAPCVLTEADKLAEIGVLPGGFFGKNLLMSDSPPMFSDFFSDGVARTVRMKPLKGCEI